MPVGKEEDYAALQTAGRLMAASLAMCIIASILRALRDLCRPHVQQLMINVLSTLSQAVIWDDVKVSMIIKQLDVMLMNLKALYLYTILHIHLSQPLYRSLFAWKCKQYFWISVSFPLSSLRVVQIDTRPSCNCTMLFGMEIDKLSVSSVPGSSFKWGCAE